MYQNRRRLYKYIYIHIESLDTDTVPTESSRKRKAMQKEEERNSILCRIRDTRQNFRTCSLHHLLSLAIYGATVWKAGNTVPTKEL